MAADLALRAFLAACTTRRMELCCHSWFCSGGFTYIRAICRRTLLLPFSDFSVFRGKCLQKSNCWNCSLQRCGLSQLALGKQWPDIVRHSCVYHLILQTTHQFSGPLVWKVINSSVNSAIGQSFLCRVHPVANGGAVGVYPYRAEGLKSSCEDWFGDMPKLNSRLHERRRGHNHPMSSPG